MFTRQRSPLLLPLAPALTGLALSVWNITDSGSVPCPTAGCSIQTAFAIGGMSLWWPGVLLFMLLSACAVAGQRRAGRRLAGLAVLADLPLLLLMLLSAPCAACLVVGLCIALTFMTFKEPDSRSSHTRGATPARILLAAWSLLFIATAGLLINGTVKPWPIAVPAGTSSINIYFSSDCTACRRLIFGISQEAAQNIAWYPVAENAGSATAALALERALQNGLPMADALREARAAQPASLWQSLSPAWWRMQIRLWINRSHVLLSGHDVLPMVEFHGVPEALLQRPGRQATPAPEASLSFLNLENAGACTGSIARDQDCTSEPDLFSKKP